MGTMSVQVGVHLKQAFAEFRKVYAALHPVRDEDEPADLDDPPFRVVDTDTAQSLSARGFRSVVLAITLEQLLRKEQRLPLKLLVSPLVGSSMESVARWVKKEGPRLFGTEFKRAIEAQTLPALVEAAVLVGMFRRWRASEAILDGTGIKPRPAASESSAKDDDGLSMRERVYVSAVEDEEKGEELVLAGSK